jgi:hypothetical protein
LDLTLITARHAPDFSSNTSTDREQQATKEEEGSAPASKATSALAEPADLEAFRQSVGGDVRPMIVELKAEPTVLRKVAAEREGREFGWEQTVSYAQDLMRQQNDFLASLSGRGVRVLLRETNVKQINGADRRIQYRFTYLLNGFVVYVAPADIERLRAQPEVMLVSEPQQATFHLDKAIDYSLGTQTNPADRRTAVYGPTKEFRPIDTGANPETPRPKIDGFEGQGQNIAVIDSGVDYRHPQFGGTGLTTPLPRVSGNNEAPNDNKKVIYFYTFNEPIGDPTDDFGHGTLVASNAAGYSVDGNTPPRPGFGTGRDGTGIGPTTNNAQLIGTAPQARIMAYKVCGPAPNCAGDIELSVEDAASPFTLVSEGNPGPMPRPKPIADVINLSLGDTSGDPAGTTSRACNNAALAGTIVVASAGNSGPGPGTIGAPAAATLAISVAAGLDPGSVAGSDVLAAQQIPLEPCDSDTRPPGCNSGTQAAGPPKERGASSNANAAQPGAPQGIRVFPVAGGGGLPVENNPGSPTENTGSVSAHYVYVDRTATPPAPVPTSVTNRIAVVRGTGTFGSIANPVALQNPAAILIVTTVESATAVVVVGEIPTFTINPTDAGRLLDLLIDAQENGSPLPANGAVLGVSSSPIFSYLALMVSSGPRVLSPAPRGFSFLGSWTIFFAALFRTVSSVLVVPRPLDLPRGLCFSRFFFFFFSSPIADTPLLPIRVFNYFFLVSFVSFFVRCPAARPFSFAGLAPRGGGLPRAGRSREHWVADGFPAFYPVSLQLQTAQNTRRRRGGPKTEHISEFTSFLPSFFSFLILPFSFFFPTGPVKPDVHTGPPRCRQQ